MPYIRTSPQKGEKDMPASKAQQRATNKYIAKAYDRINLTVSKGKRDIIQAHAEAHSESVNGFINRAIQETMERDSGRTPSKIAQQVPEEPSGAGMVSLPFETLEAAQRAAEAAGETVSSFVSRAVEQCIPRKAKVITVSEEAAPKFVEVTIKEA